MLSKESRCFPSAIVHSTGKKELNRVAAIDIRCSSDRRFGSAISNPSPLTSEFIQARVEMDTLTLNAHEAATLVSMTPAEFHADPQCAATHCLQLIIDRGGDPTFVIPASGFLNIAPPQVISLDTVGAGDAFAGACASGRPLEQSIVFANGAGALATQARRAQPSIPWRDAILALMGRRAVSTM